MATGSPGIHCSGDFLALFINIAGTFLNGMNRNSVTVVFNVSTKRSQGTFLINLIVSEIFNDNRDSVPPSAAFPMI